MMRGGGGGGGGDKPDTNSTGRNFQREEERERSVPSTISRIAQFVTGEIQIIRIKSWTQSMRYWVEWSSLDCSNRYCDKT
jgi:hypothetical protein